MTQLDRISALLGEEAMRRLRQARVAVFGIGGVGGYVCEALVRSGIGALDLFDHDTVSLTNLNRQIVATHSTLSQDKAAAMAARLRDIDPEVRVTPHQVFYLPENAANFDLTAYTYVVDAVDTVAAKLELAERCEALNIPHISAMGAGNKLDPSLLRVADIYQTSVCPLARVMRTQCRKRGIRRLLVTYSTEEPRKPLFPVDPESPRRAVPASAIFVPAAMGLLIASTVVRQIAQGDA